MSILEHFLQEKALGHSYIQSRIQKNSWFQFSLFSDKIQNCNVNNNWYKVSAQKAMKFGNAGDHKVSERVTDIYKFPALLWNRN